MDHFRNSYCQNNYGQVNGWYGNYGNQLPVEQMSRSNPSGWNGWNYNGCNQSLEHQNPRNQQSHGNNNSISYVQLNWNDILGSGNSGQSPITSSGTSAFQMGGQPTNSTYIGQGYRVTNHKSQQQQQQQQPQLPAATFTVSLGNQNNHGTNYDNNIEPGNVPNSNYEIISPQISPSPMNSIGDQIIGDTTNNVSPNQMTPAVSATGDTNISNNKVKGEKYLPCGNCKACKFQKARKSSIPFGSYLIRNTKSNQQTKM